jgi:NADH-quinone oxidoreductase subunit F/NADP-reducing hydrogenase subunit HndC
MVCGGTGCISSRSDELIDSLKSELVKAGYDKEISVVKTGCFGFCAQGPIIKVHPDNVFYVQVGPEDAQEIVQEHIVKGRVVERLLYDEDDKDSKSDHDDIPFYKKQLRIALRNCGLLNPEDINEYIAFDGYMALGKALTEM